MNERKHTRGRRMALGAAGLGILAILGTGYVARHRILEEWCLYRLDHGSTDAKIAAAERLGALGSSRAVPRLVSLVADALRDSTADERRLLLLSDLGTSSLKAIGRIGSPAVPTLLELLVDRKRGIAAFYVLREEFFSRKLPWDAPDDVLADLRGVDGWSLCVEMVAQDPRQGVAARKAASASSRELEQELAEEGPEAAASLERLRELRRRAGEALKMIR